MGDATTTQPHQGFQDPKLAQVFATRIDSNKTTSASALPSNPSQNRLLEGAIAGGVVGGIVLVLLIATFFFRRRRMVASPQSLEMSEGGPEIAHTDVKPQELQTCELYELQQPDSKKVFELPSAPVELEGSTLETPKE